MQLKLQAYIKKELAEQLGTGESSDSAEDSSVPPRGPLPPMTEEMASNVIGRAFRVMQAKLRANRAREAARVMKLMVMMSDGDVAAARGSLRDAGNLRNRLPDANAATPSAPSAPTGAPQYSPRVAASEDVVLASGRALSFHGGGGGGGDSGRLLLDAPPEPRRDAPRLGPSDSSSSLQLLLQQQQPPVLAPSLPPAPFEAAAIGDVDTAVGATAAATGAGGAELERRLTDAHGELLRLEAARQQAEAEAAAARERARVAAALAGGGDASQAFMAVAPHGPSGEFDSGVQ